MGPDIIKNQVCVGTGVKKKVSDEALNVSVGVLPLELAIGIALKTTACTKHSH